MKSLWKNKAEQVIRRSVDYMQSEGAVRWGKKQAERNPHCYKWIIYKSAVQADISGDDRVHASANCRRWKFNSIEMKCFGLT